MENFVYRTAQDKDLITLTSYLYLGYNELMLKWVKYKGAKNTSEAMTLLKPIIVKVVKDLNLEPSVFGGVRARELAANDTIQFIINDYKNKK